MKKTFIAIRFAALLLLLTLAPVRGALASAGPPNHLSISGNLTFDPSTPPPCVPTSRCHATGAFIASAPFCRDRYLVTGLRGH